MFCIHTVQIYQFLNIKKKISQRIVYHICALLTLYLCIAHPGRGIPSLTILQITLLFPALLWLALLAFNILFPMPLWSCSRPLSLHLSFQKLFFQVHLSFYICLKYFTCWCFTKYQFSFIFSSAFINWLVMCCVHGVLTIFSVAFHFKCVDLLG